VDPAAIYPWWRNSARAGWRASANPCGGAAGNGAKRWEQAQSGITVSLSLLLLVVPGLVAMVKLAFTDVIVAIEGDRERAPLERSRELSAGHRWEHLPGPAARGHSGYGRHVPGAECARIGGQPSRGSGAGGQPAGGGGALADGRRSAVMYLGVAGRTDYEATPIVVSRDRANSAALRINSKARKIRSTSSKP